MKEHDGVLLTQEELEERCRYWQKVLRLQDWQVHIRTARHREMGTEAQGQCRAVLPLKKALIFIVDPADYNPAADWPQDMEQTLVHELLHLHFAPFEADEGTPADTAQEQAIDLIAEALVNLHRKTQEAPTS